MKKSDVQKAVEFLAAQPKPQVVAVEVAETDRTPHHLVEVEVEPLNRPESAPPKADEEQDDGMRFQCSACQAYLKPDPEGSGMKCDVCSEWFTLCEKCMPDVDAYSSDAVWLCESCR